MPLLPRYSRSLAGGTVLTAILALALSTEAQVTSTTADGNGADTFLSNDGQNAASGPDVAHGAEGTLVTRTVGPDARLKLSYLRFEKPTNLINYSDSTLTLNITFVGNSGSINVYGLADGDPGENWPEATITFNNAPGVINTGLGTWAPDSNLVLLGTIAGPAAGFTGPTTSDPATLNLAPFLEADTDGLVTLLLAANPGWFDSSAKENAEGSPPTLDMPNAVVDPNLPDLRWGTGSGAWDFSASNWRDGSGNPAAYQEVSGIGNRVRFEDSVSGASPIAITLDAMVTPRSMTNDSTKNFSIGGTGNISGPTGLTKEGSGTLSLNTFNFFTGPVRLNGGILNFSSGGLGDPNASSLSFDGGTLQYAAGNTEDISSRVVTFQAGGATIDTSGNDVFLNAPIGNGGAGSLTKTGPGQLWLGGDNLYSGNTIVAQGTLAYNFLASSPNSPAIIIASGAVVDATSGELALNSAASQILAGSGSVDGILSVPAGTFVSPATNGVVGTLTVLNTLGNGALHMNGGTLVIDISAAARDQVVVNGNLELNDGTVALILDGVLEVGSYKLIEYTGSLQAGAAANLDVTGFAQSGQIAFLSDATPGQIDLVVALQGSADLVWQGGINNLWDIEATANWLDGGVASAFLQGDSVTFDATGAASPNINLVGALFPSNITVSGPTDYTFSTDSGGKLSGATGLTKGGSGTLTILTDNDNTGQVIIQSGTVQVGDGFTPSHIGDGGFVNHGELIFNQSTPNRAIGGLTGAGSLTKLGSSTLTVTGDTGYTGATTVGGGAILQIGDGGPVSLQTSSVSNDGEFAVNSSSDLSYAGPISGSGVFVKQGSGDFTVTRTNDYLGGTRVEGGSLLLGGPNIIPPGPETAQLQIQAGGTVDLGGFDQQVSSLTGAGGRLVNNSGTGLNTMTVANESEIISAVVLADNDGSGGSVALVKEGSAQLQLGAASTFSGGLTVREGNVRLADNNAAAGTGTITLAGGGLVIQNGRTIGNPLLVSQDGIITGQGNMTCNGQISGDTDRILTLIAGTTFSFGAGMNDSPFSGTFYMTNSGGTFRAFGWTGSALATFDLGEGSAFFRPRNRGTTLQVGALRGGPNTGLSGTTDGGQVDIPSGFAIGGNNLSTTFEGTIEDAAANRILFLTKVGTGTLTLAGANLSYSGATTVNAGVLALAGDTALPNTTSITVAAPGVLDVSGRTDATLRLGASGVNQSLGGNGAIQGAVVVEAAAAEVVIAPGPSTAVLTVTGSLTLNANTRTVMELDRLSTPRNDRIVAPSITGGGVLVVTNIGADLVTDDVFQLFSEPVSGFTVVDLPEMNADGTVQYTWENNLALDGSIKVLSGAEPELTSPEITFQVIGNQLELSWPESHLGFRLEMQANPITVGLSDNWVTVPDSHLSNQATITIDPEAGTIFFRIVHP